MAVYDESSGTGQGEDIPRELYEYNPDTDQVQVREFVAPREPPETWREPREGLPPPGTWSMPRPVPPPPPLPPMFSFPFSQSYGEIAPAESGYTGPVHSEYVYQYYNAKQAAMNDAIQQLTAQKRAEMGDPNAELDPDELARIEEQASRAARRAADLQYGGSAVTAPPRGTTGGGRDMGSLAFALNSHQISEPDAYRAAWAGGFRGKTGDFNKDYRDFLVEKDRIIHQSGVNRGGGEGFYAPAANPSARIPFGGYSFRPLMRQRILI